MRVSVLCPGPSLGRLRAVPDCDLSVGVNRAAQRFSVDWFAAADYTALKWHGPKVLGRPNLLTKRQAAADMGGRLGRFPEIVRAEDLELPPDIPPGWLDKTLTCATAFAFAWGAERIDIYGADWEGTADWDNVTAGEDRSDKRWAKERADFNALADWMRQRGCVVRRRTP